MQQIKCFMHVIGRTFFAGMGHGQKAVFPRFGKHARKFGRRIAHFAGIQPHADNMLAERQCLRQRGKGFLFRQMAQETHNQRGAHAPFLLCRVAGTPNTAYHRVKRHAARRVGLRVEEDFAVHHIVFAAFLQIGIRQIEKILLVPQHRRACIINIQKRLQVVKLVGGAHFFHALIRNGNVIALRDLKHQFGLESAFNM